jgi:hypothetical protein
MTFLPMMNAFGFPWNPADLEQFFATFVNHHQQQQLQQQKSESPAFLSLANKSLHPMLTPKARPERASSAKSSRSSSTNAVGLS